MERRDVSLIRESVHEIVSDVRKWFGKLRKFWVTRQAVLNGEALWDYKNTTALASAGYFNPVKFKLFQTGIVGGIAWFIGIILDLVWPRVEQFQAGTDAEFERLVQAAIGNFLPFMVPVFLGAVVVLQGWGSLNRRDSTRGTRMRAEAAYLYLEAAYGLWPQFCFVVCGAVALSGFGQKVHLSVGAAVLFRCFLVFLTCWQVFYLSGIKIPKLLFRANHYSNRTARLWWRRKSDDPPKTQYALVTAIGGTLLLLGSELTAHALARGYAYVIVTLRHLVT
jgi:hypothetical protein